MNGSRHAKHLDGYVPKSKNAALLHHKLSDTAPVEGWILWQLIPYTVPEINALGNPGIHQIARSKTPIWNERNDWRSVNRVRP